MENEHIEFLEYLKKQMGGSCSETNIKKYLDEYNESHQSNITMEMFLEPLIQAGYIDHGSFAFKVSASITKAGREYLKNLD